MSFMSTAQSLTGSVVRTRDANRAIAIEALRRSQYKFPGRQKIIISKKWGFTPLDRAEYTKLRKQGKVRLDGAYVQFLSNHGPLEYNMRRFPDAFNGEAGEEEDEEMEAEDEAVEA